MPSMPERTTQRAQLLIDLSLHLTDAPILDLIDAADRGYRLYELFGLQDADSLVHFVDGVVQTAVPRAFSWWHEWHYSESPPSTLRFALDEFAPPFTRQSPEHLAWLASDVAEQARQLARPRWPEIEAVRHRVRQSTDPLVRYEVGLIDGRMHPNDVALEHDPLSPLLKRWFRWVPEKIYSDRQRELLRELLALPLVSAFTHRGRGEMDTIRSALVEQRQRCGAVQECESAQFPVRVLSGWSGNSCFDPDDDVRVMLDWKPAWMRGARLQCEGLQIQGLFFDENGVGGRSYAQMEQANLRDDVQFAHFGDRDRSFRSIVTGDC